MKDPHYLVTWEVEDGYAGRSRPQRTQIPLAELEDAGVEEGTPEFDAFVEEWVREDFLEKVTYFIKSTELVD